jgi:YhcH/YjgK/YiaL family protein
MNCKVFKLNELGMVNGLPLEVVNKVLELAKNPVLGRYDFENKIYINVETYEPAPFAEEEYESHKDYVDVQILLKGRENLYCPNSIPAFKITKLYVPDIQFMDGQVVFGSVALHEGEFCMLTPEVAHKPCIRLDNAEAGVVVVKAVIKLPVELYTN